MQTVPTAPSRRNTLRQLILPLQGAVLETSVIEAIRSKTIRLRTYITLLTALRVVHRGVDARLPDLPLRVPIAPLRRLPALDADLRTWDPQVVMNVPPDEPRIMSMDAFGLVGAVFAMECLRQATTDIAQMLARAFTLPPDSLVGLSYHSAPDPLAWQQCHDAVDRIPLTAAQDVLIADGARTGMELLLACHQGIEP